MEHNLVNGIKIPLTPQEIAQRQADETAWQNGAFDRAMSSLRAKRNALLKDSDYTVLQDSTFIDEEVAKWVVYRQKLRDITEDLDTVAKVNAVVFPDKP